MNFYRIFTILLSAGTLWTCVVTGQPRPENEAAAIARAQNHPGDRALRRFSRMTPEERQRWLATLPPKRRQQILQKFRRFQNLPPDDRDRVATRLERLHSLPPERQTEVRRSLQQLQTLPDDRKITIRREMRRMGALPDEERLARMNSPEFRNFYSPDEQQMMKNLSEVLPPGK
jgi:Protein of unknown function (DUF3106)